MDLKQVAFEKGVKHFKKHEFIFERHIHVHWGRSKSGFAGYYWLKEQVYENYGEMYLQVQLEQLRDSEQNLHTLKQLKLLKEELYIREKL